MKEGEVAGVKVMNFYGPVPCVSALSLPVHAALPLKDRHAGQFVLQGGSEWPAEELKTAGGGHQHMMTHTLPLSHTVLLSQMICDLSIIHSAGTNALGGLVEVTAECPPTPHGSHCF